MNRFQGNEILNSNHTEKNKSTILEGLAASQGIAIGRAYLYDNEHLWVEEFDIQKDMISIEKERFDEAIKAVIKNFVSLKSKLEEKLGQKDARILDPNIMLLQDPVVIKETHDYIEEGKNAEFAFFKTARKLIKAYKRVDDEYMKERITDIQDVIRRVTLALTGRDMHSLSSLSAPVIVVAPNLNPSDTANMHSGNILAFATDKGGMTSHATIIARAFGIPAVVNIHNGTSAINQGDVLIVDGNNGKVYINPDQQTIDMFCSEKKRLEEKRLLLLKVKDIPAITKDGVRVGLNANIEFTEESDAVLANGAEGIGLFRSEYHYLYGDELPSEEELYQSYFEVAKKIAPKTAVIRTLDIGGDKISHIFPTQKEANPFLGWRAIRISLTLKELFRVQLRAILRASALKNVALMFPMVSCMEELNEANALVEEVKSDLRKKGTAFDENIKIGVMIELPAAVMISDHLAKKVAFFSIGTNDLIQYSVAVDRSNDKIANLFDPFHPGILKLIKITADSAHANGIPVAVCGEMSGDPKCALLLLGLGIDELSMIPSYIPSIKNLIMSANMSDIKAIAEKALLCESAVQVKNLINDEFKKINTLINNNQTH